MTVNALNHTPARVAIVDDSRSIRRWLRLILEQDPRLQVVGEAGDAREARDMLRGTSVDVMTLDVDMPGMTGIEFLARLMAHRPMPVVMLSALTEEGSREAVEALSLGAVDCIEKPRSALGPDIGETICARVWEASQTNVTSSDFRRPETARVPTSAAQKPWKEDIVLLGASTGGVGALEAVLAELDELSAPVVIAQHMPEHFLRSFCRRLNEHFSRRFVMAEDGLELSSGQAVLALGKTQSTRLTQKSDGRIVCRFGPPSENATFRPSVDDLFLSAAEAGIRGNAALLTGMGSDGANGLMALRHAGFETFAQNESSCVVYGMPKAAMALGAALHAMTPSEIGRSIAQNMTQSRSHMQDSL